MQDFFAFTNVSQGFRLVSNIQILCLYTPITEDAVFIFTEDCVALDDKTVKYLKSWQVPEQIVNLLFLMEIDVQATKNRHCHE